MPRGVTNHFSRIAIPDTRVSDDDSFMVMLENIRAATFDATAKAFHQLVIDLTTRTMLDITRNHNTGVLWVEAVLNHD